MADIADVSNDNILLDLDRRLCALQLARPARVTDECEECGDSIPLDRVQALKKWECVRCVDCQQVHEFKEARGL